jgi:sarcosine oxidase subunit alpha
MKTGCDEEMANLSLVGSRFFKGAECRTARRRMPDSVTLSVNGTAITVPVGAMVSTAVAIAGVSQYRRSVSGEPRGPLCGMGICFECRVIIDGRAHCRSCQVVCQPGMEVLTDG